MDGILGAAGRAASELTWEQQLILMARYRRGLPLGRIARGSGHAL